MIKLPPRQFSLNRGGSFSFIQTLSEGNQLPSEE